MKGLHIALCICFSVLAQRADCCLEYNPNEVYHYGSTISPKSEVINNSLKEDVAKLLAELKSENRMITPQDSRSCANEFFMKHSMQIAISGKVQGFTVKSDKDQYEIPVRLYTPAQKTTRLVMFIHGGGWMQGNLDTHDYLCRKMVNILGCKVLAVDYRLAPEYRFPIGLEDVESVYKWCAETDSSKMLGKISEIYISGDSAGGNLSAALNLKLKESDWKGHLPDGLILFYPALSSNVKSASFGIFKDQRALSAAGTVNFIEQYLNTEVNDPKITGNKFAFPLNGDAEAYPKTIMIAAECDVLLDGQIALLHKLSEKNMPVKLLIANGAVHGFMTFGKEFDDEITGTLRKVKEWL